MTINHAYAESSTATHIYGFAEIKHSKGADTVWFIAPLPRSSVDIQHDNIKLDDHARFFVGKAEVQENWSDVCKGTDGYGKMGLSQEEVTRHLESQRKRNR